MKLREGFVTHQIDDDYMLVSTGEVHFQGVVKCNHTAAFIIEQLRQETSVEQIKDSMLEKYDVDETVALKNIEKVLENLREIGALDE